MTEQERAEMYREFLVNEGYAAKIDEDGDVFFKCEGMTFLILITDDDEFFRLVCPDFWSIEDDAERTRVVLAAGEVNARIKVAKVYPVRDDTWASVEMYCSPPSAVLPVLLRAMGTLRGIVRAFGDAMHESAWSSASGRRS